MKEALRLALEALGNSWTEPNNEQYEIEKKTITAIKAALEAEDEPFGFFQYDIRLDAWVQNRINNKGVAFYIKEKNNG